VARATGLTISSVDVLSGLAAVVVIGFFVLVVILTEVVRRPRSSGPGEDEAKARSTGDESMNAR
jgi:hypothetical protein